MKIKLLAAVFLVSFSQCSPETKKTKEEKKTEKINDTDTSVAGNDFQVRILEKNTFPVPFVTEYDQKAFGRLEFEYGSDFIVKARIHFEDNSAEALQFDFTELIPRISTSAYNNNYHQQLSVYLYEKQWHTAKVESENANPSVSYYEVVNPPRGEFWFLNAIQKEKGTSRIVASYRFKLPEAIMSKQFEKVNNRKFDEFKKSLFLAPDPQKIDYNSIRKMGRFYEGFAASLNNTQPDYEKYLSGSIYSLKKTPKKFIEFYDTDFEFPEMTENGYDTLHFSAHSLKELYASKNFTYKTTYPLIGENDSLLELQFDFATKENKEAIRFVMGGIVFSEIPRLKSNEMESGLHLPIGFSKYKNPEITKETFVLMGNTSGYWMDNTYGRNVDEVIIYFDKNSPYKLHIWLMGGDATIPVGHYLTSLDQIKWKQ